MLPNRSHPAQSWILIVCFEYRFDPIIGSTAGETGGSCPHVEDTKWFVAGIKTAFKIGSFFDKNDVLFCSRHVYEEVDFVASSNADSCY
eukprot:2393682-Amphidinium_carterae.1